MAPLNEIDLDGADAQDQAEVMDETHLTKDGEMIANFDTIADVYDATQEPGDADEDEPVDADDYAPDDLDALEVDDDALEDDGEDPYEPDIGVDSDSEDFDARDAGETDAPGADTVAGLSLVRNADTVEGGEDDFTNYESKRLSDADVSALGYGAAPRGQGKAAPPDKPARGTGATPEDVEDNRDPHTEKNLDDGVEETFPASDPVSIHPGAD